MGFIQSIVDAINRTFIVDNRYQLFLQGLENTLIITVFAAIIGILLGTFVAICKVYHHQTGRLTILDKIMSLYLTLFRGTPIVVQLLIWAFVVFVSVDNEAPVAVFAFGINSGAYVAEIVRAGIMAVDEGQTEAGRSLGLGAGATMRYIVLPQAFKNILPALSNEVIALLKETSVVGYIAVTDLTKAADLVRARTFDAFLPLLFVALIYLLLVILLTLLQRWLERRLQFSDRRKKS